MMIYFISCTSSSKNSSSTIDELKHAQLKVPGITMERFDAGKKLYVLNCSGCHSLKKPDKYSTEQWKPILQKMFIKAKLTDEKEKILIIDYVVAKSK